MLLAQDDHGRCATEGVAAVGLQAWNTPETALPILTPAEETELKLSAETVSRQGRRRGAYLVKIMICDYDLHSKKNNIK